jgi:CCR4-NOT transcription complex subunit 6
MGSSSAPDPPPRPPEAPEGSLTLATYNCLADCFVNEFSFPYCDPAFKGLAYRLPLIQSRLQGLRADVLCLQEVDMPEKGSPLIAFLQLTGYETEHVVKKHTTQGIVLAWRDSLVLEQVKLVELDDWFSKPLQGKRQGNNALMAVFRTATGAQFALATTHLHWNPKEEEVKYQELVGLLQAF